MSSLKSSVVKFPRPYCYILFEYQFSFLVHLEFFTLLKEKHNFCVILQIITPCSCAPVPNASTPVTLQIRDMVFFNSSDHAQ